MHKVKRSQKVNKDVGAMLKTDRNAEKLSFLSLLLDTADEKDTLHGTVKVAQEKELVKIRLKKPNRRSFRFYNEQTQVQQNTLKSTSSLFSEFSDHVLNKNKLLDRKCTKEVNYYNREMRTNCRLLKDKQRAVLYRHDKMFPSKIAPNERVCIVSTTDLIQKEKDLFTDVIHKIKELR